MFVATILIADDNVDILEAMGMHLEALGHRPILVSDPDKIIDTAATEHVDLLLQDMRMGQMSLAGLAANLRTHPDTKDMPFVFFSAHPKLEEVAKKHGAWGYLPKPFTNNQLERLLDRFLGGQHRSEEPIDGGALMHTFGNVLASFHTYVYVLQGTDMDARQSRAVDGLKNVLGKLENLGERFRVALKDDDLQAAAERRPQRPQRGAGASAEGAGARPARHEGRLSTPPERPT